MTDLWHLNFIYNMAPTLNNVFNVEVFCLKFFKQILFTLSFENNCLQSLRNVKGLKEKFNKERCTIVSYTVTFIYRTILKIGWLQCTQVLSTSSSSTLSWKTQTWVLTSAFGWLINRRRTLVISGKEFCYGLKLGYLGEPKVIKKIDDFEKLVYWL